MNRKIAKHNAPNTYTNTYNKQTRTQQLCSVRGVGAKNLGYGIGRIVQKNDKHYYIHASGSDPIKCAADILLIP